MMNNRLLPKKDSSSVTERQAIKRVTESITQTSIS